VKREDDVIHMAPTQQPFAITSTSFMIISYLSQTIAAGNTTETEQREKRGDNSDRYQTSQCLSHLRLYATKSTQKTQLKDIYIKS